MSLKSILVTLGATSFILAATTSAFPSTSSAISVTSGRDCDSNAVIHCGALSTTELNRKYDNQQDVRTIFRHFGINGSDMNAMDTTAVEGKVTKSGRVIVDGETIATDATTAGRHNMAGSTKVTRGDTTFYVRSTETSFASSSLSAFVVMKDGQFDFAVLASCGNPVKAKPVPKPKKPEKKEVPPKEVVKKEVITQTVVVEKAPPPPPPPQTVVVTKEVPVPAPQPAPAKSLPATGSEDLITLAAFAAVAGMVFHQLFKRRLFLK